MSEQRLKKRANEIHFGLSLRGLAKITGISISTLHLINNYPQKEVSMRVVETIYKKTKEHLGTGIKPWEYLNVSDYSEVSDKKLPE